MPFRMQERTVSRAPTDCESRDRTYDPDDDLSKLDSYDVTDFFISYNKADREWAEWIAYVLEEEGFSTSIQAWDFRPGTNFVLEMQEAAAKAVRTVMVLSPDYLTSEFAASEWAAAFSRDPRGLEQKLVPVMVRHCEPEGLLRQIVCVELIDLEENEAHRRLLEGIRQRRAKPEARPPFPKRATEKSTIAFPGPSWAIAPPPDDPFLPNLSRKPSDAERRRFVKTTFAAIAERFRNGLKALEGRYDFVETDIEFRGDTNFVAEVFMHGRSECACHVWLGGAFSRDAISYYEGRSFSDNTVNEMLSVADDSFLLCATMGSAFGQYDDIDLKRLTSASAADYLWRRFVEPLDRKSRP